MLQHGRYPFPAEAITIASTTKLHILHITQAFLPISFNYRTSTLFCEYLPAEAFAPRCLSTEEPGGISEIKSSSFYRELPICAHRRGKGQKPAEKTNHELRSFIWGRTRTYFRDQRGSDYGCSQKQQISRRAPTAILPFPCVSVITHYSHT